jgi:hypothetical protein
MKVFALWAALIVSRTRERSISGRHTRQCRMSTLNIRQKSMKTESTACTDWGRLTMERMQVITPQMHEVARGSVNGLRYSKKSDRSRLRAIVFEGRLDGYLSLCSRVYECK